LVAGAIFDLLATIIVLEILGIHLAPVWTKLGVGSVAIALALQKTLGNLSRDCSCWQTALSAQGITSN